MAVAERCGSVRKVFPPIIALGLMEGLREAKCAVVYTRSGPAESGSAGAAIPGERSRMMAHVVSEGLGSAQQGAAQAHELGLEPTGGVGVGQGWASRPLVVRTAPVPGQAGARPQADSAVGCLRSRGPGEDRVLAALGPVPQHRVACRWLGVRGTASGRHAQPASVTAFALSGP
jgi:hypothetical protein